MPLFLVTEGCGNIMPDVSNLSHFLKDIYEISIYLFWDEDFTALTKKSVYIMRYIFFLFLKENIWCGYSLEAPHRGASNEYPQICFLREIRKLPIFGQVNLSWINRFWPFTFPWTSNNIWLFHNPLLVPRLFFFRRQREAVFYDYGLYYVTSFIFMLITFNIKERLYFLIF